MTRAGVRERGNALIEFALAVGVLSALFIGTFQFGYSFHVYGGLLEAVRDGARYGSLQPYDSGTSNPSPCFRDAVRNMVVYGDPDPAANAKPLVRGLKLSNVEVKPNFINGAPDSITVAIRGFKLETGLKTITLNGKPKVTFPYLGTFVPVANCTP